MSPRTPPPRRSSSISIGVLVLALLAVTAVGPARQGPPEHVRRAVDALLEMLRSEGDRAIGAFLDRAADPSWLEARERGDLVTELRAVRDAVRGIDDEIAVEAEPDGVRLELSGGGLARTIRVLLSEAGIRGVELLDHAGRPAGDGAARDAAVRGHLQALESSARRPLDEIVDEFERERFSPEFLDGTRPEERRALLEAVREAASDAGGVMVDARGGETALRLLSSGGEVVIRFRVVEEEPYAIESLRVDREAASAALSWDQLDATFRELQERGVFVSGVVHFARDGEVVLERGYGTANADLDAPADVDTVFGIGSTPIDFTVAALLLLDQRGELTLDDPITEHLDDVPTDKASITLRHLITGQSGLPDFHHQPGDWDADLAWIDRETAVRRILAQPLLFEPGSSRAHSHSAYGLVAAILEIVSGRSYERFVHEELFGPAGMTRTGMYGQSLGLELADFAVGAGRSSVGVPNIPPDWGPTSWLVLGSGGMASTVPDLLRFYRTMRAGGVLDEEHAARFRRETVGVGGSDRGFFLFHAADGLGDEALILVSGEDRSEEMRELTRRIRQLVME